MYHITAGSTHTLPDVETFVDTLNTLEHHPLPEARALFTPGGALTVTRAPGQLEVMGGSADYAGSLVLQLPTREATLVALQRDPTRNLKIVNLGAGASHPPTSFEILLDSFEAEGQPITYEIAQTYFQGNPEQQWAAYAAGAFLVLMRERGVTFIEGARLLIDSNVPEGKGISSSVAMEVAVMQAIAAAFNLTLTPWEIAWLSQKVENLVVGDSPGIRDPMTAACGQAYHLLALLCQPAELQEMIALPGELAIWGLDSGVRHSVSGADYGSVRAGAFMGYRLIADQAGLAVTSQGPLQPVKITDPVWGGYLANITPSEFAQYYATSLPQHLAGDEFLAHYTNTTDPVTQVNPQTLYAVRIPTAHSIYEHFRARSYAELLGGAITERQQALLGEVMYQSHASYSACNLGSNGTDRLVKLVRQAGPQTGLYGAKITGGGSGGIVAVLGRQDAGVAVEAIAQQYAQQTGYQPYIFKGSSPGAAEFGTITMMGEPGN